MGTCTAAPPALAPSTPSAPGGADQGAVVPTARAEAQLPDGVDVAERRVGRVTVMSVHPRYADQILAVKKRVEFHKRPVASDVTDVLVYSTAPVDKVLGVSAVDGEHTEGPCTLWRRFRAIAGTAWADFLAYYEGAALRPAPPSAKQSSSTSRYACAQASASGAATERPAHVRSRCRARVGDCPRSRRHGPGQPASRSVRGTTRRARWGRRRANVQPAG